MENKKTKKEQKGFFSDYPSSSGVSLGFICGLFTILGLIGGFLYPVGSNQREEFITGWKYGFATTFVLGAIACFVYLTAVVGLL